MEFSDRLRKKDWEIRSVSLTEARPVVERFHYAGGASNTATHLDGLYRKNGYVLLGVAWWLPPTRTAAQAWWNPPEEVLCLSRLVIHPAVPKNGATFLLMGSVRRLAPRWRCLLTYADTWRNHTGHIYKAAGWEYLGLAKPERTYTLRGRMVARKATKSRTHQQMLDLGAVCIGKHAKHRFRLIRKGI